MITISRSLIRRLRVVFGRGLAVTSRGLQPAVQFVPGAAGLSIRARNQQVAIEYQHPEHAASSEPFAVPLSALKECEGTRDEPVCFMPQGKQVEIAWTDGAIPQTRLADNLEIEAFPLLPGELLENDPRLLAALRDAADTSDPESTRYALGCLRLRGGEHGDVAATDGRQLLIQDGFSFPWDDAVLVPASRVFQCRELADADPVAVGRIKGWVTIRVGHWKVHLSTDGHGRFPDVETIVPETAAVVTRLELAPGDAEFLTSAIKRLPSGEDADRSVTVDLNGQVAIRARAEHRQPATALVLSNSRSTGDAMRFNSNREYLSRAVRLGFRELHVANPAAPICCRDGHRLYVWGPLAPEGAIEPRNDDVEVASPPETNPRPVNSQPPRRTMPRKPSTNGRQKATAAESNGQSNSQPNGQAKLPSVLEQAQALQTTLQQALSETRVLVATLRKRKRESKLVRSTLASLRQLQAVDV